MLSWILQPAMRRRRCLELDPASQTFTPDPEQKASALRTVDALWDSYARLRTIVVAAQLKLPEVLGRDRVSAHELQVRLKCANAAPFRTLLAALVHAGLLVRDDDDGFELTALGGVVGEGGCWYDVERLFDPSMERAWDAVIPLVAEADHSTASVSHDDTLLATCVGPPSLDYQCEILEAVECAQLPRLDPIAISYWGMCDATDTIHRYNPNAVVAHMQAPEDGDAAPRASVLILHRSFALYGCPDVGRYGHEAAIVLVVDDARSDPIARLYAAACGLSAPPDFDAWSAMLGMDLTETRLPCGAYALQGSLPTRV